MKTTLLAKERQIGPNTNLLTSIDFHSHQWTHHLNKNKNEKEEISQLSHIVGQMGLKISIEQ